VPPGDDVRGILFVGLKSRARPLMGAIAPRLLTERGEWIVASGLRGPPTPGQRVTYLASLKGEGIFDAEVCDDGVIIVSEKSSEEEVSPEVRKLLTEKGWSLP
jgi:hypothetical protein